MRGSTGMAVTRRRSLPLAAALDAHAERLQACRRCAYGGDIRPITSSARAPLAMLVGQAPGKVEASGGRPFAGRAGQTLFRWFATIGLDEAVARDLIYISAVTRCFPGPHPSGRGDRVPSPAERQQCSHWLEEELRIIRPSLLIPVGRLAIDHFLGPLALDVAVGREHEVTHAGGRSVVIPLPHPSGASSWIHAPGHRKLLEQSLELIQGRLAPEGTRQRSVA
jgi:uracil-DNA glycosylase